MTYGDATLPEPAPYSADLPADSYVTVANAIFAEGITAAGTMTATVGDATLTVSDIFGRLATAEPGTYTLTALVAPTAATLYPLTAEEVIDIPEQLLGDYTIDTLEGSVADQPILLNNAPMTIAGTTDNKEVTITLPALEGMSLQATVNTLQRTLTVQPQTAEGYTVAGASAVTDPVVGTYDEEYTITVNDMGVYAGTMLLGTLSLTATPGAPVILDQSIVWDQAFDTVALDEPITLEAHATSELAVTYTLEPTDIATLEGNILTFSANGSVTVTATQEGDAYYHAAEPVTKTIVCNVSGIGTLDIATSDAIFYDLRGVRVLTPQPGTLYIAVDAAGARRVIAK